MRALVVFESMFGNTAQVADAVAAGIREQVQVEVSEVGSTPPTLPDDLSLLVVGGPTHAFGMSRVSTRQDAARQASVSVVSSGLGLREWLEALPTCDVRPAAATFDTRVDKVRRLPGSAARGAARELGRHGIDVVVKPASFYVEDIQGPLVEGELERARQWGASVAAVAR